MSRAEQSFPPYALVSPVRDEASTVGCTLASVLAQSVRPVCWVIVDDGSRDATRKICENAAAEHDFIRLVHIEDRGYRKPGAGVVHAFQRGLEEIADMPWEFVGKLDGDVEVPCRYYESLLSAFGAEPRLGIASGACLALRGDGYYLEKSAPHHTRGPCKMYRRTCLEEIGGLRPTLGWDGLDGYQARMLGWHTRTLPGLKVLHFRPTLGNRGGLRATLRSGRGPYYMRYRLDYLLIRAGVNLIRPPYLLGTLGLVLGYLEGHLKGAERLEDPELTRYIRREQKQRLVRILTGRGTE
jgi:glycosyltransferase involved in cell wall biosynthesis